MEEDKEEGSSKKLRQDNPSATAASLFTDDLILEVLSRLPARSVRRFKCVSVPWRDLIADPVHRKKLPQTLAGFLYTTKKQPVPGGAGSLHFASISGSAAPFDPSLPFLQPNKYAYISHVDTCNGLLLCARYSKVIPTTDTDKFHYVVCNPATERWIKLPPPPQAQAFRCRSTTRLAFDPAVSSHFHVLEFVETLQRGGVYFTAVDIFSFQTGAWIRRDSGLVEKIRVFAEDSSVFFGGMLHLICELVGTRVRSRNVEKECVLVVDMEGEAWKTIHLPVGYDHGTIGLSQGCLCYASSRTTLAHVKDSTEKKVVLEIALWCLENYDSKEWVMKHSASIAESWLMGNVFAINPDCSTVFSVPLGGAMLASYDLQHQKLSRITDLEKGNQGTYLPYVPLFSEALADADGQ